MNRPCSVCVSLVLLHMKNLQENRDLLIFMYTREREREVYALRKGFISMVFAFHLMVRGGKKTFAPFYFCYVFIGD